MGRSSPSDTDFPSSWQSRAIRFFVRYAMLAFLYSVYRIRMYDRQRIPRVGGAPAGVESSDVAGWLPDHAGGEPPGPNDRL